MRELIARWIAWHLPRAVVAWATVRVAVHGTTGAYSSQIVPELTVVDALRRWDST